MDRFLTEISAFVGVWWKMLSEDFVEAKAALGQK